MHPQRPLGHLARVLVAASLGLAASSQGTIWTQVDEWGAMPAQFGAQFGRALDIDGDTAVVGAPREAHSGFSDAGAVYVFVRSGGAWSQAARLTASDPSSALFGQAVSLRGGNLAIGAPDDGAQGVGACYVFTGAGSSWTQQALLPSPDFAQGVSFGGSVAIEGDTLAIGDKNAKVLGLTDVGSACVYERSAGVWTLAAWLAPTTQELASVGSVVVLSGERLLVGAPGVGPSSCEGTVYVYVRSGGSWLLEDELLDPVAGDCGFFGAGLTFEDDWALVPSSGDGTHVFERGPSGWSHTQTLDGISAADMDDDRALLLSDPPGEGFLYRRVGSTWLERATLDLNPLSTYPSAALFGPTILVGDPEAVFVPTGNGLVKVFEDETTFGACPSCVSYCTAGTSASGCMATISAFGTPSASASLGFVLTASSVQGGANGLFYTGTNGRQANPWGSSSSFQCVVPPVIRTPLIAGFGLPGSCAGQSSLDMHALWTIKPNKNPGPGAVVQAQLWYRDPQSTSNQATSLSDALEFVVAP
jgi:hypothetical protein